MSNRTLICCASWEDRFAMGVAWDLAATAVSKCILFYYDDFGRRTAVQRSLVADQLHQRSIPDLQTIPLRMSTPLATWKRVQQSLELQDVRDALVDISTMPRELLWFILWHLEQRRASVQYVYHRPQAYSQDWLSREPLEPRLVLKMSGIARFDRRTALVVMPGYDTERVAQLLRRFEPASTKLLLQKRDAFHDNDDRMAEHRERFSRFPNVEFCDVDAYSVTECQSILKKVSADLSDHYNVLLTSLGPKLSAIATYQFQRDNPSVGILYVPSRDYNSKYSVGIGSQVTGVIPAPALPVSEVCFV